MYSCVGIVLYIANVLYCIVLYSIGVYIVFLECAHVCDVIYPSLAYPFPSSFMYTLKNKLTKTTRSIHSGTTGKTIKISLPIAVGR